MNLQITNNLIYSFLPADSLMINCMFASIFEKKQVLRPIVSLYVIYMVNNLAWQKGAAKLQFRYIDMLQHIIVFTGTWMTRNFYSHISSTIKASAFFRSPFFRKNSPLVGAGDATIYPYSFFCLMRLNFKGLLAEIAQNFYVRSYACLRAMFFAIFYKTQLGIKNFFTSLALYVGAHFSTSVRTVFSPSLFNLRSNDLESFFACFTGTSGHIKSNGEYYTSLPSRRQR